jgi:hypothetical protein
MLSKSFVIAVDPHHFNVVLVHLFSSVSFSHQSDVNLRPLVYRSRASFRAFTPPL